MVCVPSISCPFSSFPLRTHLFSSFLLCPPVFTFCHLIPSFVCARVGPGLSVDVHIHIHFLHRFQVAQVLTMRLGSSVVPVHLVSFSLQPHTPLSRHVLLLMSSSFLLSYCARTFNENILAFLAILGLITPAYLLRTQ